MNRITELFNTFRKFINDPLGLKELSEEHFASLSQDFKGLRAETSKSFNDVLEEYKDYAKRQEEKAQFYCMSLENIGDVIPDMLWMKWVDGTYAYANKAIRDNLLFCDDPIGLDDTCLGKEAVRRFGVENHDFGKYCAGSDDVVISYGHRRRFIEYGMSGGRPLVLEVFKNVVRGEDNEIIATVGCGRDITDNIFTMFKLDEACGVVCSDERVDSLIIGEYLDKYLYENPTINETLRDFYRKTKDLYYG